MPRNLLPSEDECYAAYVQNPPRLDEPRPKRKKLNDLTWPELKALLDAKDWEEPTLATREKTPRICLHCHHYQQGPARGKSSLSHRCPVDATNNIICCTDFSTCPTGFRKGHEDEVDKSPQTEVGPSSFYSFIFLIHSVWKAVLRKRVAELDAQLANERRKNKPEPLLLQMDDVIREKLGSVPNVAKLTPELQFGIARLTRTFLHARKHGCTVQEAEGSLERQRMLQQKVCLKHILSLIPSPSSSNCCRSVLKSCVQPMQAKPKHSLPLLLLGCSLLLLLPHHPLHKNCLFHLWNSPMHKRSRS
jgi:hypothetical protein